MWNEKAVIIWQFSIQTVVLRQFSVESTIVFSVESTIVFSVESSIVFSVMLFFDSVHVIVHCLIEVWGVFINDIFVAQMKWNSRRALS